MGRLTILHLQALFLLVTAEDVLPAGNSKLSGRIFDQQTGKPVLGNVQLAETVYGAASDSAGRYFVLDIPPGTYDIRCSAVGYTGQVLTGLVIAPDNLRTENFALLAEDVDMEEFVVQANRLAVESSETSARTDFDGSEFRALPLNSTTDLIALSPATFKQFVGGVLPVFSRTTVDGIDVTDGTAFWFAQRAGVIPSSYASHGSSDIDAAQHSSYAEPNLNAIEQATLFTGTSGPDYSNAASTLVYSLREGRGAWGGEASLRMSQLGGLHHLGPNVYWDADEYFAQRAMLASGDYPSNRESAEYFTWTPGKYPYGGRPDITASLAVGGSLSDALGIHLTGAWRSFPDRLPNEKTARFNGTAKITWALSPTIRLGVVGLLEDRGRLFGWKNSTYMDLFRYFLEGVPKWDGIHFTAGVKLSHFLSQATTYELQASVVHDNVRRGFCDDNDDGVIAPGEDGDFLTWADKAQVNRYQAALGGTDPKKFFATRIIPDGITSLLTSRLSWKVARPPIYYENSTSRNVTLKGDLSSQVDPHHFLGVGAQLRLHTVGREIRNGSAAYGGIGYKSYLEEVWTRHPVELGFYLQDRVEYSGLIMNVGLRLEGVLLDAAPIVNWYDPPDTVVDAQWGPLLVPRRGALLPWKWFLSPRVGFSHPIGNDAAVHVSFSRTSLSLPFSYLFANYNTRLNLFTTVNLDQETISAMNYDLGFQWAVLPATLLGVNAYYHDYNNMYGAQLTLISRTNLSYVLTNAIFSEVRGIEISLQRGLVPLAFGVSAGGRIAYTYSLVSIGNPVPANKTEYSVFAGDSAAYGGGLPFDDVTLWNKSNIEVLGGSSTLLKGFDRNNRITCAITIAFPWNFRLSGTGVFSSGFWYPEQLKADYVLPYAESAWNRRIDVRLEKQFVISGRIHLDFFVDVLNLCNWTNVLAYYTPIDGRSLEPQIAWEVYGDPTGGYGYNRPVNPEGTLIYDIPREMYFGIRIGF